MNYYNDNDPKCCAWLRELIKSKLIPEGEIDSRSIAEIQPSELKSFPQCHFFAGIGGWAYALQLAGWPEDRPVWTGSCPCQPFSSAGKRKGVRDSRDLWPAFRALIAECKPPTCFGEQVAGADGRLWLTRVRTDMEGAGYAVGAANLCAAGVSAPHIRQRFYWVAHGNEIGCERAFISKRSIRSIKTSSKFIRHEQNDVGLGDSNRYHEHWWSGALQMGRNCIEAEIERSGRKYRSQWRVKPGLPLLANGIPGRVAQLCGFGNAIVPQLAAEFIQAADEAINFQTTINHDKTNEHKDQSNHRR